MAAAIEENRMPQISYRAREYLWVVAPLDLEVFCQQFRVALQLPSFTFDAENVWEWGLTRIENGYVEINVSRKHRHGVPLVNEPIMVLLLVDHSAPINLDKDWLMENLVGTYGQALPISQRNPPILELSNMWEVKISFYCHLEHSNLGSRGHDVVKYVCLVTCFTGILKMEAAALFRKNENRCA